MESAATQHAMAYRATWEIQSWDSNSAGLRRTFPGIHELIDATYLRDLTIQDLRESLCEASIVDFAPALMAIGFLVIGEVCLGLNLPFYVNRRADSNQVLRDSTVGVRTHIKGLQALVKSAGGLDSFSGAVVAPIMWSVDLVCLLRCD
jgi:hypothetical protein